MRHCNTPYGGEAITDMRLDDDKHKTTTASLWKPLLFTDVSDYFLK